jgi:AcrR family transcriptional regulator
MGRTLKNPEIRRQEIIDAAQILFEKQGYDNTPVESIINAANIAKGTFYYYFETKKDVLDAIVKAISQQMYDLLEEIVKSETLSTMDKLSEIFVGNDKRAIVNSRVMTTIHSAENRELQEKLNIFYVDEIIPLITNVFNQGYEEKLWDKKVSLHNMKIILGGAQFVLDSGLFTVDVIERKKFMKEIGILIESLICAVPGTFQKIVN